MPECDGGGDVPGAEEPNSRRAELRVWVEVGWMAGQRRVVGLGEVARS